MRFTTSVVRGKQHAAVVRSATGFAAGLVFAVIIVVLLIGGLLVAYK
jgi:tetrahydromethanopterin S-methyltransferase subunit F